MTTWYIIGVNLLLGTLGLLIGFKIYVPTFKSDEAKVNFYKRAILYKIGGAAMLIWALYQYLYNG
jgi:hypothetical protein